MAIHRLKPRFVETVKAKGMYADGGGLYLQVGEGGSAKSWIFRYHVEGRGDRQMGLGPLHTIGLAEARERARKCREQRLDGFDPIEARNAERLVQRLEAAKQVIFETCAEEWIKRNAKVLGVRSQRKIRALFQNHLNPVLGKLPVSAINVDLVESAIKPIWDTMQRTGQEAVVYLKNMLDWAAQKGYRQGDNPASMNGPLGARLSPFTHTSKHHPRLPYQEIGAFMAKLRATSMHGERPFPTAYTVAEAAAAVGLAGHIVKYAVEIGRIAATRTKAGFFIEPAELYKVYPPKNDEGPRRRPITSYALEFLILTAVRSHQVLSDRGHGVPDGIPEALSWEEINWGDKIWTCPPERTKAQRLHEIPLSDDAMAILEAMRAHQKVDGIVSEYVFVHGRSSRPERKRSGMPMDGKPIASASVRKYMVEKFGRTDITVHGFRRTFSTWAHEDGRFLHNDIEMALAHLPEGNRVSHIYNQAKRLEPRRLLLEAWAGYCGHIEPLPAEVVPFRKAK